MPVNEDEIRTWLRQEAEKKGQDYISFLAIVEDIARELWIERIDQEEFERQH